MDNNLPPALARALHALSESEDHQVIHLSEKFSRDTPDIEWMQVLKDEGGWVIISQDQFRKSDLEKLALRQYGLVVFCLAKHWARAEYWDKAYQLVRWWPALIGQAERIQGGAAFRVPWKFSPPGKFEQIKV
ncbi:MAG: hypothetical protein ABNH30_12085 [Thalassolituus sp.]